MKNCKERSRKKLFLTVTATDVPSRDQSMTNIMLTCQCNLHPLTPYLYAPSLKKLMGHIAFEGCVRACVTLFVPTKNSKLVSFPSYLQFWSYGPLKFKKKNLVSIIFQKVFKLSQLIRGDE